MGAATDIMTPSGRLVDIAAPRAETICLEDIAHKLAQVNRWGGSAKYPYSVARHAVFVSRRVEQMGAPRAAQLLALHHDSHEAYLGDIPRPWKASLGARFEKMTARFDGVIWEALDLPPWWAGVRIGVKRADNFSLVIEAKHLMPDGGAHWRAVYGPDDGVPSRLVTPWYWLGEQSWTKDRRDFIYRHRELTRP